MSTVLQRRRTSGFLGEVAEAAAGTPNIQMSTQSGQAAIERIRRNRIDALSYLYDLPNPGAVQEDVWNAAIDAYVTGGEVSPTKAVYEGWEMVDSLPFQKNVAQASRDWQPFAGRENVLQPINNVSNKGLPNNWVFFIDAFVIERSLITFADGAPQTPQIATADQIRNNNNMALFAGIYNSGLVTYRDGSTDVMKEIRAATCWSDRSGANFSGSVAVAADGDNNTDTTFNNFERGFGNVWNGPGRLRPLNHPLIVSAGRNLDVNIRFLNGTTLAADGVNEYLTFRAVGMLYKPGGLMNS